jgi:hypothetical protein
MHASQNDYPGTYMLQRYSAFFSQKKRKKKDAALSSDVPLSATSRSVLLV